MFGLVTEIKSLFEDHAVVLKSMYGEMLPTLVRGMIKFSSIKCQQESAARDQFCNQGYRAFGVLPAVHQIAYHHWSRCGSRHLSFRVRLIRHWARLCTRIAGALLVLPLVAALLLLLSMVACNTRPRILVSPDSRHVAEYSYEAGFLGR